MQSGGASYWVFAVSLTVFTAAGQSVPVEQPFSQLCAVCHGAGGAGTDRGPALANSRALRTRSENDILHVIRNGVGDRMPAFPLPDAQLRALARFVRSLNASAFEAQLPGDVAAGEAFFFGAGRCGSCHSIR